MARHDRATRPRVSAAMSDKPEAPASGEQTGSCRYRLTTDSPFYCIRDSGHDGDHAFDRVHWTFLPAEEEIVALEADLARERELRQAAEQERDTAEVLLREERRQVATAGRERDYYRDGYEIALDQWEQCRDGWDAAERERNRQWDDAEVARQGLWTAEAALAALEAELAREREQTQRWRKAAIDYINVLETERELRQAASAKVVVWEERAALRQRKLKAAERERDYYRDGYEIALDQWEQSRDGWDAAEAALAALKAKYD